MTSKPHSELVETIRVGLGVFRNLENGDARNAYDALNELIEQLEAAQQALYANGHRPPGAPSFHLDGCSGCEALAGASFPATERNV